jgi:transcriptional regulator with XRE-family HTH domain
VSDQETERVEDFAQLIARIKDTYSVSDSEIARRIDVSPATVNAWVHRKRGGQRGPAREKLEALALAFPKFSRKEIFEAAKRRAPGPPSPDGEARIQALYRELTTDQQSTIEIQMRALAESNRTEG